MILSDARYEMTHRRGAIKAFVLHIDSVELIKIEAASYDGPVITGEPYFLFGIPVMVAPDHIPEGIVI